MHRWGVTYVKGFGQVMLQEKWLTGLFFLAGILANSWIMLLAGLLASAVGLTMSLVLKFDTDEIEAGYFGFNSALVGICVFFYLPVSAISLALLIGCAALSTLLMQGMLRFRWLPPYTAPFVVSAWVALFGAHVFSLSHNTLSGVPTDLSIPVAISQGVGQIMFQENTLSGVLIIAGLAVSLPLVAVWAVVGSVLGLLTAVLMDLPIGMAAVGI